MVTGASSDIGRATALHFLAQGWRVGLVARSVDKLAKIDHANAVAFAL